MANDKFKGNPGLSNARSASTIFNNEHHDKSLSKRTIKGSPGTIDEILATSSTAQPVPNNSIIRVVNTNAATQYLFIGKLADAPGGAPDITTGLALPPNCCENIYIGTLADCTSTHIKSSSDDVQVVVFEI